jgi:hypothetical protein
MAWPRGEYKSWGTVSLTPAEAFEVQFKLEQSYPAHWYRWLWNGQAWNLDERNAPDFLASTVGGITGNALVALVLGAGTAVGDVLGRAGLRRFGHVGASEADEERIAAIVRGYNRGRASIGKPPVRLRRVRGCVFETVGDGAQRAASVAALRAHIAGLDDELGGVGGALVAALVGAGLTLGAAKAIDAYHRAKAKRLDVLDLGLED